MATTPHIPDHAPFTPEQRAWLNGFLAGMFTGTPATAAAPATAALSIAVLYATQTGTGEGLARKIAKELKSRGHTPTIAALESYAPDTLATQEHAVIVASTYGEGDPPDPVKPFFDQLCMDSAPRLEKLSYAVLALGDSHYEHFCKFGVDLDDRLSSLGATRICNRVECDVDLDEPFTQWKANLLSRLEAIATGTCTTKVDAPSIATPRIAKPDTTRPHIHTRDNPLFAPLVDRRALTHDISSKLTVHLAFSTADSQLHYEAGDACGVIAQNDPHLVDEILNTLAFPADANVHIDKAGTTTLRHALQHHLQITRLTRKMLQSYATQGKCQTLLGLLIPEQQAHLDKYTYDRGLIDLLTEYPGVLSTPEELIALLPKLAPRLYSISSSPLAHRDEVHNTVAVVRYRSHNRERGGVCSTMLAERIAPGEGLPIYIQPNKKFRLPAAPDAPIIMVGPGTGIAPFRAFLHERQALAATGRNWLFFGERSASTDFLYREELASMQSDGILTRLDTAFSRDQEHKIYVQDRMVEHGANLWSWLQDGATLYVCGDASRMAKDVDNALHTIVQHHGHIDHEAAKDFVQNLKDQHRYHRDVY